MEKFTHHINPTIHPPFKRRHNRDGSIPTNSKAARYFNTKKDNGFILYHTNPSNRIQITTNQITRLLTTHSGFILQSCSTRPLENGTRRRIKAIRRKKAFQERGGVQRRLRESSPESFHARVEFILFLLPKLLTEDDDCRPC